MQSVLRRGALGVLISLAAALGAGCGSTTTGAEVSGGSGGPALRISAIPDQDPQELQRLYPVVADYLSERLGVPVSYRPVTDYAASVTGFKTGDLDLVWFGGLTAVQAAHQVEGARPLAQRDVDTDFKSVFIAGTDSGLQPIEDVEGLKELRGRTFSFGSESSTSGRVMPQYFLDRAGLDLDAFRGAPGFSGSHDATIAVVEAGTYDAGVLNRQVWESRVEEGKVDTGKVQVIWETPGYHDYQWVARPDLDDRFEAGFTERLQEALLGITGEDERQEQILELFGAGRFVPVEEGDDAQLRQITEKLGLIDKAGA